MFRPEKDPSIISGWDVRQYSYCPIIPWIKAHYGVYEPATFSMEIGKSKTPTLREGLAEELNLPSPCRAEVFITNPERGLTGVIDLLCGKRWFSVVEVKAFKRKYFQHFLSQLHYYVYLVNHSIGPVREAYLVLGKKTYYYVVDGDFIAKGMKLANETKAVKLSVDPPNPRQGPHCEYCWYRRFCPFSI